MGGDLTQISAVIRLRNSPRESWPDLGKSAVEVGRCRRQVRRAAVGGSRVLGRGLDVGLPVGLLVGLGHLRELRESNGPGPPSFCLSLPLSPPWAGGLKGHGLKPHHQERLALF